MTLTEVYAPQTELLAGEQMGIKLSTVGHPYEVASPSQTPFSLDFYKKFIHNLRSPLASIMGYADLLSDPEIAQDPAFLEDCHQTLVRQVNHLCQLMDDVMSSAYLASGELPFQTAKFSLEQLLRELQREVQTQSNRTIHLENLDGVALVQGDALRLRDVFLHLLDNALNYSAPETPVDIKIWLDEDPDWICVGVRDYGVGIDADKLGLLFQPFRRVRNEVTAHVPGTGLGLYIVRLIIQAHGGHILVESKLGDGSHFIVKLPLSH